VRVDALDLAEPSLVFGPSAAGQQVVLELVEPGQHLRVYGEHWAAQTSLTEMILLGIGTIPSLASY